MELAEITWPGASRPHRTTDVPGRREVHITLVYDEADIEDVAGAVGVDVGPAERDAMLMILDDAIADAVRDGIRCALGDRIREEVELLAVGHARSEDE